MNRTALRNTGLLVAILATLSSCALLGFGSADEIQASLAAGALLDYVAAQGLEQVQELDTASETYDLQSAGSPSTSSRASGLR